MLKGSIVALITPFKNNVLDQDKYITSKVDIKEENAKEINWLWEYNLEKSLEEAIKNRYDLKIKKFYQGLMKAI